MRLLVACRPRQLRVARLVPRLLLLLLRLRDPPSFHFISDRRRLKEAREAPKSPRLAWKPRSSFFLFFWTGQDRRGFPGTWRRSGYKSPSVGEEERGMHPVGAEPALLLGGRFSL